MKEKGIFCLEGKWYDDLRKRSSVRPILELLELNSDIPYIKRIIGLPGEVLEVRDNRVFINGIVLSESYILEVIQDDFGPVTIPDDHIFVMGDNRRYSRDSRIIGPIPIDDIVARAWFRVWPLEDLGPVN